MRNLCREFQVSILNVVNLSIVSRLLLKKVTVIFLIFMIQARVSDGIHFTF